MLPLLFITCLGIVICGKAVIGHLLEAQIAADKREFPEEH